MPARCMAECREQVQLHMQGLLAHQPGVGLLPPRLLLVLPQRSRGAEPPASSIDDRLPSNGCFWWRMLPVKETASLPLFMHR